MRLKTRSSDTGAKDDRPTSAISLGFDGPYHQLALHRRIGFAQRWQHRNVLTSIEYSFRAEW